MNESTPRKGPGNKKVPDRLPLRGRISAVHGKALEQKEARAKVCMCRPLMIDFSALAFQTHRVSNAIPYMLLFWCTKPIRSFVVPRRRGETSIKHNQATADAAKQDADKAKEVAKADAAKRVKNAKVDLKSLGFSAKKLLKSLSPCLYCDAPPILSLIHI